jgi:hypothetical protein
MNFQRISERIDIFMLIESYPQSSSIHRETVTLKNILAWQKAGKSPTEFSYTEALLFGIGGGIGAGYQVLEKKKEKCLILGVRHLWQRSDEAFIQIICKRVGIPAKKLAKGEGKTSGANLKPSASEISALKNYRIAGSSSKKKTDIRKAIISGLHDCCQEMLYSKQAGNGLSGLEKFADLLTDRKSRTGWTHSFKPGRAFHRALMEIFQTVETQTTGGGAFRLMQADFLDEAAIVLGKDSEMLLKDSAAQFRRSAKLWKQLAHNTLPDSVSLLCEAREILIARRQLLAAKGASVSGQMEKISRRLAALEQEADEAFPLTVKQSQQLLSAMQSTLRKICEVERPALKKLQQIAG